MKPWQRELVWFVVGVGGAALVLLATVGLILWWSCRR